MQMVVLLTTAVKNNRVFVSPLELGDLGRRKNGKVGRRRFWRVWQESPVVWFRV
jgi:hypothetical protein